MARRRTELGLALALAGCRGCVTHPARPPIVCDGELDEPAWHEALRTGPFLDDAGAPAAPYSDARFVIAGGALYVGLYAGDEDIRSDDEFTLRIGAHDLHFHPGDHGPDVGVDRDGTIDDARDDDEEWIVEARLPLAGLPHGATPVVAARCDTTKDGVRRCGSARLTLTLP